ncbi:TIGR03960 family B12-binding radical SAM protein [Deferribacterales bacterium Es71-Z0220]|uniref:TIGR03960 family B12-binding radical SAM protein n=1 Tax=Deferrivibrio essentukiensis TaxID=2880922 RepID=UPI001F60D1FB|nr:TIGR03960 family B12-binding radical SAM protein [Deferrivibrio essentukiensis]MCB4204666.1 TIGR03960 family B12-binding radical SAM protein [Deferrivibrio essentukiensis]
MEFLKLLNVNKPLRYINNEFNSYHKNNEDALKFCLIFPDVYEVGMSHLGIKILYERLNQDKDIICERFFMPWVDALDEFGKELFVSLESQTPLSKFDIIGFSLQYELSYTNMLKIISESGIPLLSEDRVENSPIVIAGGPCVVNPAPIEDFIDVFFIGEMEEELIKVLNDINDKKLTRREKLEKINEYKFTYIPALQKNKIVRKNIYKNFHNDYTVTKPVVPLMPIVQDRVTIEISRGCTRGCRFCQAGMIYRPSRERNVSDIIENAIEQIKNTGYLEVSLLSLSAADYSCLEELLLKLSEALSDNKVSLSLPSIRADRVKDYIFQELKKVRKSGFTIAPEAGSQRMRNIINKNLTEEEIIDAVVCASNNGFNGAKLYFMIGLPFETDEDVLEIANLAVKIKRKVRKSFNITVSVSNFVPKPFTPFQWFPQNSIDEIKRKQTILSETLKSTKIRFKFHDPYQSILEGAISRGDRRMGKVLINALSMGNIYDGWSEHFIFDNWLKSFEKAGLTFEETAMKSFDKNDILPWDNIDTGVTKEFLWQEYEKSKSETTTDDCRETNCKGCGICDFKEIKNIDAIKSSFISKPNLTEEKVFEKIAFVFSKKNISSLFSAIDLNRVLSQSFNIAAIELDYSKGFNPQPKLSYLYPLPVGVEGENEILLTKIIPENLEEKLHKLNSILPKGLYFKTYYNADSINLCADFIAEYEFDNSSFDILKSHINLNQDFYQKKGKNGNIKEIKLKDYLIEIGKNYLKLRVSNLGTFNFVEFFKFLNYNISKIKIKRKSLTPFEGLL